MGNNKIGDRKLLDKLVFFSGHFEPVDQVTSTSLKYEISLFPIFRKQFSGLGKTTSALYSKIRLLTPPDGRFLFLF